MVGDQSAGLFPPVVFSAASGLPTAERDETSNEHMKTKTNLTPWLPSLMAGLLLTASAGTTVAQTWANPKTFDSGKGSWITWNGWGLQDDGTMLTHDPTLDAGNDPLSGSLRYAFPFTGAGGEQMMTFGTLSDRWGWDNGTIVNVVGTYKTMQFDFKLDPATLPAKNGTFGSLRAGLVTGTWGQVWLGYYNIPASATNWTHVSFPIDPSAAGAENVTGYCFYMWSGDNFTNMLMFNIDNIYLEPSTNEPPPPPPTMGIAKAGPSGVQITMDNKDAQWQRDGISTPAEGGPYLWTSQGSYPVSYSFTIADFPSIAEHPGFEAHMYLVNGDTGGGSQTSGSPDWNVPDLLIVRIENTAAGDVLAMVQWKTNYPAANATNVPVRVNAPSAIGTWTLTFTDSTHGTLAGPGITATNFTLPEDAVLNNFSPATSYLHFGIFKNDGANDGHNNYAHGTFSRVTFTGAAAAFDDEFNGPTLTNKYAWRVSSASAVQHIPPGIAWVVDWTTPATGFNAQSAAGANGPWNPATFTRTFRSGSKMFGLVPQTALPGTNSGFFRLIQRPFVKLQVLMPGEIAAPHTPTGKTGTPDTQTLGVPFTVTVNAVDEFWNIVPSTHTINITSSDALATLPADADLVNGTKTFSVTFNGGEPATVTATDVTDPTKTANTGTLTPVQ